MAELGHAVALADIRCRTGNGGDQPPPVFLGEPEIAASGETLGTRRCEILVALLPRDQDIFRMRVLPERRRAGSAPIVLASSAEQDRLAGIVPGEVVFGETPRDADLPAQHECSPLAGT